MLPTNSLVACNLCRLLSLVRSPPSLPLPFWDTAAISLPAALPATATLPFRHGAANSETVTAFRRYIGLPASGAGDG